MRDDTREVLNMLMHSFPSLGSWFAKQDASLSETWSKVLSHVDPKDAMSVVERFIRGDVDMPPNYEYDRIAILIRRECARLADRRAEQVSNEQRRRERERYKYCDDARQANSEMERFMPAMRELLRTGEARKNREITQEENDRRRVIVERWYRDGGDVPEFM